MRARVCLGYNVLGIDYFEGESVLHHLREEGFDWRVWMEPHKTNAPLLAKRWIAEVRKQYGLFICTLVGFVPAEYCRHGPLLA